MSSSLLQTKLIVPFVHPQIVPRNRLSEQIEMGIEAGHRLTLVAAPAGYGKSTAVSVWVHQSQQQAAWLSLDDSDNEPAIFWTYVLAAIQTILPGFGETILTALAASPTAPANHILPTLLNELAGLKEHLILVLDDYHVIENQEIHSNMAFILDHQPQQFHLIVATRADPPLPVARFRAQRSLTELRAKDMRFTLEEARTFLNQVMGLGLSSDEVKLLETRTEGWGVGLLLAAQSMQGRYGRHEFIATFSGSQHYILEYLVEEVLKRQSETVRRFLIQVSILDRICGPLCNAVTGGNNGGELLRQISKENLFIIPLDQEHLWYRYHHLFADLLANVLQKEMPRDKILALHQRASQWHQVSGDTNTAVKYALSGQDFERAANLIEQIVDQVIARGQIKLLLEWVRAIPEEVIKSRPRLLMHQGWIVFLSGNVKQGTLLLKEAKRALSQYPPGEERNLLRGRLSAMLATITALTPNIAAAISEAQEALAYLPRDEFIFRARARRALGVSHMFLGELDQALKNLEKARSLALEGQNKFLAAEIWSQIGTLRKLQGKFSLAAEAYQQILELYEHPEQSPPACLGFIGLAEIALERNDLAESEKCLKTGVELCQQGSIGYALQPAYLIGGLLKYAQGDRKAALETIRKGEALSKLGGGSQESILGLAWFQARLYLQLGELEKARGWATGDLLPGEWSFDELPIVLDEMHQSLLARVYLHSGEFEELIEVCDRILTTAEKGGRLAWVIELSLFKALVLYQQGRINEAFEFFERCLRLAEPNGMVRLFLEGGETVIDLLRVAQARGICAGYSAELLAAFSDKTALTGQKTVASPSQANLIEPLTTREREVLSLMCEGYSNQHIAEALIVSVNTIKKHTSNIYGKLGVRNRAQAVLRARAENLV